MNLPEKLTYLRKQKGLTQQSLAETLNVSRQAISRWEVGTAVPSTDNLKVLGNLYAVPVDYLLDDNADDSCWNVEKQEREPTKQDGTAKIRNRKCVSVFVCGLILAAAIVIIICFTVTQGRKQKQEQIVPIGEMDTIVEDDYPVETFCIGW